MAQNQRLQLEHSSALISLINLALSPTRCLPFMSWYGFKSPFQQNRGPQEREAVTAGRSPSSAGTRKGLL